MIYWFTGQPGSGKTTLGLKLVNELIRQDRDVIHIDGDTLRKASLNQDYSKSGRARNVSNAQTMSLMLHQKGFDVVVSMVSPYNDIRRRLFDRLDYHEYKVIHVFCREERERDHYKVKDYEVPEHFNVIHIDTTDCNSTDSFIGLLELLKLEEIKKPDTQYSMFVGRWQPFHEGHRWLINQRLQEDKNILICIRDTPNNKSNPFTTKEVVYNLQQELEEEIKKGRVILQVIPDIESINYGRKVGYDVIEHKPPEEIFKISATKIREERSKHKK